jgi:hypothetical protein
MSDASDNSTTVNKYLVPVTTDNIVLKWDGNTASLAGILYETFQFWEREGLFQEFLLTNAVPIKGGKLAVDSDLAIQFMDGTINDSTFRSEAVQIGNAVEAAAPTGGPPEAAEEEEWVHYKNEKKDEGGWRSWLGIAA